MTQNPGVSVRVFARRALAVVSLFLAVATLWFAVMEAVLRHPGYVARIGAACLLFALSLTLWRATRTASRRIGWRLASASVAAGGLGLYVFVANARGPGFEGYIAVIALVLMVQAALVLLLR